MSERGFAVFLAARLLPRRLRESVLADLREEEAMSPDARRTCTVREIVAIAASFHAECYRAPVDRLRIGALAFASLVLLWAVPLATATLFAGPEVFTDPVSRAIVAGWRESHVTSALAAGLLIGRAPFLPVHALPARAHVVVPALAFVALRDASVAAAAVLVVASWLAARSRDDSPPEASSAGD